MKNKGTNRLQIVAGVSLVIVAALCCAAVLYSVGAGGGIAISVAPADASAEAETMATTLAKSDVKVYFANTDWANMVLVEDEYANNDVFFSGFIYFDGEYENLVSCTRGNHVQFDQEGEVIPWEKLDKPRELWYPEITIRDPEIVEHDVENGRMYPLKEGETVLQLSYGGATTQVPITVTKVTPAEDEKSVEDVRIYGDLKDIVIENVFYSEDGYKYYDDYTHASWYTLELEVKYAGSKSYVWVPAFDHDAAKVYVEDESIAVIGEGRMWPYELYTRKGGKTNIIVEIYGQRFTFPLEVKDNKLEGLRLDLWDEGENGVINVRPMAKYFELEMEADSRKTFRLYALMSDGSEINLGYNDIVLYECEQWQIADANIYGTIDAGQPGKARISMKLMEFEITLDVTVK